MPRTCTVCRHPRRGEIDRALLAGAPERTIAHQHAVSRDALHRHKVHIPATLARAKQAREAVRGGDLLNRPLALNRETLAILQEARQDGRRGRGVALLAIARAEKQIELQARLLGELRDHGAVTVNVDYEQHFAEERAVTLRFLADPEATRLLTALVARHDGLLAAPGAPTEVAGESREQE